MKSLLFLLSFFIAGQTTAKAGGTCCGGGGLSLIEGIPVGRYLSKHRYDITTEPGFTDPKYGLAAKLKQVDAKVPALGRLLRIFQEKPIYKYEWDPKKLEELGISQQEAQKLAQSGILKKTELAAYHFLNFTLYNEKKVAEMKNSEEPVKNEAAGFIRESARALQQEANYQLWKKLEADGLKDKALEEAFKRNAITEHDVLALEIAILEEASAEKLLKISKPFAKIFGPEEEFINAEKLMETVRKRVAESKEADLKEALRINSIQSVDKILDTAVQACQQFTREEDSHLTLNLLTAYKSIFDSIDGEKSVIKLAKNDFSYDFDTALGLNNKNGHVFLPSDQYIGYDFRNMHQKGYTLMVPKKTNIKKIIAELQKHFLTIEATYANDRKGTEPTVVLKFKPIQSIEEAKIVCQNLADKIYAKDTKDYIQTYYGPAGKPEETGGFFSSSSRRKSLLNDHRPSVNQREETDGSMIEQDEMHGGGD